MEVKEAASTVRTLGKYTLSRDASRAALSEALFLEVGKLGIIPYRLQDFGGDKGIALHPTTMLSTRVVRPATRVVSAGLAR